MAQTKSNRKPTPSEIFRDGKAIDAAVARAVRKAVGSKRRARSTKRTSRKA